MSASEEWSCLELELEDLKDSMMFFRQFKLGDDGLNEDKIEAVFSIFEEINGELKKKHGSDPLGYDFG